MRLQWIGYCLFALPALPSTRASDKWKLKVEIWAPNAELQDTVIESQQVQGGEADLYVAKNNPECNDNNDCQVHTLEFEELGDYPITIIRGTKDSPDNTHRTECTLDLFENTYSPELPPVHRVEEITVSWYLGKGVVKDWHEILKITCNGPKDGVAVPREEP